MDASTGRIAGLRALPGKGGNPCQSDLDFCSDGRLVEGAPCSTTLSSSRSTRSQGASSADGPANRASRPLLPAAFYSLLRHPRLPHSLVKTLESFEKGRIGVRVDEMAIVRLPPRDGLRLIAGRQREVTLQRFAGLLLMTGQRQRRGQGLRRNSDRLPPRGGPIQPPDRTASARNGPRISNQATSPYRGRAD